MNLSLSSNSGLLVFIAPLVENFSSDKDLIVIVIGPKDILSEGVGVPPECGNIPVAPVDAFCSAAKCRRRQTFESHIFDAYAHFMA